MKEIKLNNKALVMVAGSSRGIQPKYYESGYWYKVNQNGYEGLSEYLVSLVLKCSNVDNFVVYRECLINDRKGCFSKSFLNKNEQFISFERLHYIHRDIPLLREVISMDSVPERIEYVKEFVYDTTGVDCTEYLSTILALDALVLNTDRHFNNLGIVINEVSGNARPAPIFDNGAALFSNVDLFDGLTFEENLDRITGEPFSANLDLQAYHAGIGLKIDYDMLNNMLKKEPPSRALETLQKQLELKRKLIPDFKKPVPGKNINSGIKR